MDALLEEVQNVSISRRPKLESDLAHLAFRGCCSWPAIDGDADGVGGDGRRLPRDPIGPRGRWEVECGVTAQAPVTAHSD